MINNACSKSSYLIIEFLAGIYCVQRFYLSNILHILHLRSFVSLCGLTAASSPGSSTCVGFATRSSKFINCQSGLVLLITDYNEYPAE